MITTYLDSSAVLRIILGAPSALPNWRDLEHTISSALMEVECFRTIDRLRMTDDLEPEAVAAWRETLYEFISRIDIVEVTMSVLRRAAQPLPVPLKTLDAIHLATATLWRDGEDEEVTMATHDASLSLAARAVGLKVIGV